MHTVLLRARRPGCTLCILSPSWLICLKGNHCMKLRLEQKPLEGIRCLHTTLCIGDISLLLELLTGVLLRLNDNRLHLKM